MTEILVKREREGGSGREYSYLSGVRDGLPRWTDARTDSRAGKERVSPCLLLAPLSLLHQGGDDDEGEGGDDDEGEGDGGSGGGEAIPSWETLSVLAFGERRGEGRKPRRRRRRIRSSERHLEGEGNSRRRDEEEGARS